MALCRPTLYMRAKDITVRFVRRCNVTRPLLVAMNRPSSVASAAFIARHARGTSTAWPAAICLDTFRVAHLDLRRRIYATAPAPGFAERVVARISGESQDRSVEGSTSAGERLRSGSAARIVPR